MNKYQQHFDKVREILDTQTPLLDKQKLKAFVEHFISDSRKYTDVLQEQDSPLYLIDEEALIQKAVEFRDEFKAVLPKVKFFYALKSNSHPFLIQTVISQGYGIDVSSGKELRESLVFNPQEIIFSGPGKTPEELSLAVEHADKVIILLDNFSELRRLNRIVSQRKINVRVGVRLMIEENGLWRKFGIALSQLEDFIAEASNYKNINLCGLQFHASWNLDASKQTAFCKRLAQSLSKFDKETLKTIKFVDIGGGYWPDQGEWMQPSATQEGQLLKCLAPQLSEGMDHRCLPALSIADFANQISQTLNEHLLPYVDCEIFMEPGRVISHESMHILLKVVDKKASDVVITDGGTNIIGWERFEMDFFPVINLTRPSLVEHPCMVFGSLCTPHDVWGYSYFGENIEEGDVLLIPTQGAYTYSLRQDFIKPLAGEVILKSKLLV